MPLCRTRLLVLLAAVSLASAPGLPQSPVGSRPISASGAQTPSKPGLPSLFLVGDTAPITQPGSVGALATLFDPARINLVDRSIDHRTSRGLIANGDWSRTLALVKSGDFVLFQIAESDPGLSVDTNGVPGTLPGIGDEIREVFDPTSGRPEIVHTYGWYLRQYVVETIARGAIPMLCSLPPSVSADGKLTPTPETHGSWAYAIATQQRVVFLDLDAAARALNATAGSTAAEASAMGARSLVAALKGLPTDPLAGYFSSAATSIPPFTPPQQTRELTGRSPDMPALPGANGSSDQSMTPP